ncbi:MAG TPA: hypothetical protein PK478_02790 [Nitrospira sp.]|nr:hypothetical protein [Nitrospira sp.]
MPEDDRETSAVFAARQRDIIERLVRIEVGVNRTNGRVSALEDWRVEHSTWSDGMVGEINGLLASITTSALAQIEAAVGRALDSRETAAKAAKLDALQERFGKDLESDLSRWSAITRLSSSTMLRLWMTIATLAAGAGAAAMLERLF